MTVAMAWQRISLRRQIVCTKFRELVPADCGSQSHNFLHLIQLYRVNYVYAHGKWRKLTPEKMEMEMPGEKRHVSPHNPHPQSTEMGRPQADQQSVRSHLFYSVFLVRSALLARKKEKKLSIFRNLEKRPGMMTQQFLTINGLELNLHAMKCHPQPQPVPISVWEVRMENQLDDKEGRLSTPKAAKTIFPASDPLPPSPLGMICENLKPLPEKESALPSLLPSILPLWSYRVAA